MLPAAIVATSLAVVPMVERCRSALMQFSFVPEAAADVRLQAPEGAGAASVQTVRLASADMPPSDEVRVALMHAQEARKICTSDEVEALDRRIARLEKKLERQ